MLLITMLAFIFVFVAVFSQCSGNPDSLENHNIFCYKVDKDLDYGKFFGSWYTVAMVTSEGKAADFLFDICFHAEFINIINDHSHDVVWKTEGPEGSDIMFLKNVEGNGTRGCYQRVKSFDDPLIEVKPAMYINVFMTQFHLVKSTDLFLVQIAWATRRPGNIAVVYRKTPGDSVTEEEMKPVIDLVTKIRGPQQAPQFCSNDNNELPKSIS